MQSRSTTSLSSLMQRDLRTLVCPVCHAELQPEAQTILCTGCGRRYPVVDGIPVLLAERAF